MYAIFCDFCHERADGPTFIHYCEPFSLEPSQVPAGSLVGTTGYEDDGQWAACQLCHLCLQAGDRVGLWRRALDGARKAAAEIGHVHVVIDDEARVLFDAFWEHRNGRWAPNQEVADSDTLTIWAISDHPAEHPNHWVTRPQYVHRPAAPGQEADVQFGLPVLASSLEEARSYIPAGKHPMGRDRENPEIVEVWI